ncbi:MAG: hypothetical protein IJW31_08855 [Lentisphaeria bacterium]|nr:hypothetical protein [Lentisphaeria bacterium]
MDWQKIGKYLLVGLNIIVMLPFLLLFSVAFVGILCNIILPLYIKSLTARLLIIIIWGLEIYLWGKHQYKAVFKKEGVNKKISLICYGVFLFITVAAVLTITITNKQISNKSIAMARKIDLINCTAFYSNIAKNQLPAVKEFNNYYEIELSDITPDKFAETEKLLEGFWIEFKELPSNTKDIKNIPINYDDRLWKSVSPHGDFVIIYNSELQKMSFFRLF